MSTPRGVITYPDVDVEALCSEWRPSIFFHQRIGYIERVCLERWVSECEPMLVYDARWKFRGIALAGGDGSLIIHAPPTDKFYPASGTGCPPDWDFRHGCVTPTQEGIRVTGCKFVFHDPVVRIAEIKADD